MYTKHVPYQLRILSFIIREHRLFVSFVSSRRLLSLCYILVAPYWRWNSTDTMIHADPDFKWSLYINKTGSFRRGRYRENAIAIESEARYSLNVDPYRAKWIGGNLRVKPGLHFERKSKVGFPLRRAYAVVGPTQTEMRKRIYADTRVVAFILHA